MSTAFVKKESNVFKRLGKKFIFISFCFQALTENFSLAMCAFVCYNINNSKTQQRSCTVYNMFTTAGNNAVHKLVLQTKKLQQQQQLTNEQAWWHFCELLQQLSNNTKHTEAMDTDVRECAWPHFEF